MGKNNNTNKIKARILSSDPDAGRRLNNLFLSDNTIRKGIATEVTSHYDLSHDLDAFDVMFHYGLENDPDEYFDELDEIQIGDLKIEGDEIMFLDDDDMAFEAMMDNLFGIDEDDDDLTEEDYDFAEDMFKATEATFGILTNFEGEMDEDDLLAMESADEDIETEEEAYRILLEEDDDDDLDDVFETDDDDEDDDIDLSDDDFLDDDIMLDPQFDDEF